MSEKNNTFNEDKYWISIILMMIFGSNLYFEKDNIPMFPYASNDYLEGKVDAYEKVLFGKEK